MSRVCGLALLSIAMYPCTPPLRERGAGLEGWEREKGGGVGEEWEALDAAEGLGGVE